MKYTVTVSTVPEPGKPSANLTATVEASDVIEALDKAKVELEGTLAALGTVRVPQAPPAVPTS